MIIPRAIISFFEFCPLEKIKMTADEKQERKPMIFGWLLLIEVILFFIIVAIWWFGGAHSVRRFSDISFLIGIGAMLIGLVLYWGTRTSTGSFGYQYAQTVNDADMHKRVSRDWKERFYNEWLIVVFIAIGVIPIVVGILVDKIWG